MILCVLTSDVDECAINNGGCEQMCSNTIGSFYCTCESGYQLDEDGMNCSGKIYTDFDQQLNDIPYSLDIRPPPFCRLDLATSVGGGAYN